MSIGPLPPTLSTRVILEQLRAKQPIVFRALGRSMWPAIPSGSMVRVEPIAAAAMRVGDLVAYQRDSTVVVHRIVRTQFKELLCSGDSCWGSNETVPYSAVLGRAHVVQRRKLRRRWPSVSEVLWLLLAVKRHALDPLRSRFSQGAAGRAQRKENGLREPGSATPRT